MGVLTFHVVNSIKGGAGKSLFSLLLANHLIKSNRTIIIDLDLQGSSWEENFKYFFNDCSQNKYINDLMYDFNKGCLNDVIRNISVSSIYDEGVPPEKKYRECSIPVCIANSSIDRVDDIQIDLFENAVFRLIEYIKENNPEEDINIILDMPPSKEKHAEKILTHLLLDVTSPLYKDYKYKIQLYMMTNITLSHRNKNINYLKELARNISYSDCIPDIIERDGFKLFFVLNDLSNTIPDHVSSEDASSKMNKTIIDLVNNISFTNQKKTELFAKIGLLRHLDCYHKKQIYDLMCGAESGNGQKLTIDSHTNRKFDGLMLSLGI